MPPQRSDQFAPDSTVEPSASATVVAVLGLGLVDPATPIVRADDAGLTRGDGCFEGCRLRDGVVAKLDAHLDRMTRSATALGLHVDRTAWHDLVDVAVAAWPDPGEAAVKLVITRGVPDGRPTGYALLTPIGAEVLRQRRDGVRAISLDRGFAADAFAAAPWLLGGVKTLSYAINMAATREAQRRGADDVVFVSTDGYALETPTGSLVWSTGTTLHSTPTGATGILAGTTQQLLFEQAAAAGWSTARTLAQLPDLHDADALWIVSSVRGPVAVIELDGVTRERRPRLDAQVTQWCGF